MNWNPLRPSTRHSLLSLVGMWVAGMPLSAGVVVTPTTESWDVGVVIPDNNPVGVADTRSIFGSPARSITDLSVTLTISGGFAGDLYATLTHDSGFSVLLNRIGRSSTNVLGSDAVTLDLVLRDDAASDIHNAIPSSGAVTGFFQPDARTESPLSVLDTSPRSAFLDSFHGLDANGRWTLFVADLSGADEATLDSWGLAISGIIPEPSTSLLILVAAIPWLRRQRSMI